MDHGVVHSSASELFYGSRTNLNRMSGNWWFPYDIFVVPQANGDLRYYAPGIVGALYAWNAVSQSFSSPSGYFDVMVANANGTWTRTTKDGDVWQFNTSGNLATVTNRYGLVLTVNRDAQQAITSVVDYAGRSITTAYNMAGYLASVTDWGGRTTTFTYTAQGYLASVTTPATTFYDRQTSSTVTRGKTITFTYTSGTGTGLDGNLLTAVDDRGQNIVSNTFDGGDRTTATTARGRTWNYSYLAGGATRVVDPDGVTVDYSFNASGAITRKEVYTRTGLGQTPLRTGEPNSYVWLYERASACGCDFISKITYPDGTATAYTHDTLGNLLSEITTPPPGAGGAQIKRTWTYSSFAQFSRMLTYTPPEGYAPGASAADHTLTFTYDSLGSATQAQYPKATVNGTLQHPVMTFTYNAAGHPLTRVWPSGRKDTFEYAATTFLLSKVTHDALGLALSRTYSPDTYGRLTSTTNARGYTTTLSYNALDQLTQVTPPAPGSAVTYLRDNNDNIYRIEVENRDSSGALDTANPWFTTTTAYDSNDFHVGTTREIDLTTTATTTLEWTPGGRLKKVTDPNGNVVETQYDERGLPYRTIEAPGTAVAGTYTYSYDLNGNISQVVDPRGQATLIEYDHGFRPKKVTFADQTTMLATFDGNNRLLKAEQADAAGIVRSRATWTYDPGGLHLTSAVHHLDSTGATNQTDTTSVAYDAALRVSSVTNPLGSVTTITYDGVSRTTNVTDPGQNKIDITYDANSNATTVTRSDKNQVTQGYDVVIFEHTYDSLDRVTQSVRRDPGSSLVATSTSQYDGRGFPVGASDELGNTVHQAWDGLGRLLTVIRDLRAGGTGAGSILDTIQTTQVWDAGGRLTSIKDGLNKATSYQYDARNRVTVETDPANGTTQYAVDANGNVLTATDPIGNVVTNTWDNMDRLTSRSIARASGVLGTTSETFAYDVLGRPTSMADNDSTVLRTYDSLGRVTGETTGPNPIGASGKSFAFAYDAAGSTTGITYPDGTVLQYARDGARRLTSLAIQGGATLATYQYSGRRVIGAAHQNNVTESHTFDALLRRTFVHYQQGSSTIRKFEYVWNLADMRVLEKRHHANGTGDNYGLDSLYRTVQVKAGVADPVAENQNPGSQTVASTTTLTYNKVNSRTQVSVSTGGPPTSTSYTADALEFYTSVGGTTHVRDANGNLRDDGVNLYDYDYRNQLVRVTRKSDSVVIGAYDYDVLGRRIAKATVAGTTTFVWIGMQMAAEYDSQGLFSRRHYDDRFGQVVTAQQRDIADLDQDGNTGELVPLTPLYDGAYDCGGVLGPTGALAESYVHTYEGIVAITNAAGQSLSTSAVRWQQGYSRSYRDDETGLLSAVHRYCASSLGRFLTQDPLGRWGDRGNYGNGYGWAGQRHRNDTDPLGLRPIIQSKIGPEGRARLSDCVDMVVSALSELHTGGGAMTPDMIAMHGILEEDARTLELTAVSDAELTKRAGSDVRGLTVIGGRKYWIYLDETELLKRPLEGRLWTLVHELLHAVRSRCKGKDHPPNPAPDDPELEAFEQDVYSILYRLRNTTDFRRFAPGWKPFEKEAQEHEIVNPPR